MVEAVKKKGYWVSENTREKVIAGKTSKQFEEEMNKFYRENKGAVILHKIVKFEYIEEIGEEVVSAIITYEVRGG